MSLQIQYISGEIKSNTEKVVVLLAGEKALFGIPELKEADILGNKVEWILLSQNKKDEVSKKTLKWNEPFSIVIDKLTSGSYSYSLQATYTNIKNKKESTDSLSVSSYCDPHILNVSTSINGEFIPGNSVSLDATIEGLNSNNLVLEVYIENGDKEKKVHSEEQKCIEGKVSFSISQSKTAKWKPKPKETNPKILFKLFDKNNKKYL